jgi:hypothetical protein
MAQPQYDKMTLAQLREMVSKKSEALLKQFGLAPAGPVSETTPQPTEPPVTDMPLPAARAQAARRAAIQGVK